VQSDAGLSAWGLVLKRTLRAINALPEPTHSSTRKTCRITKQERRTYSFYPTSLAWPAHGWYFYIIQLTLLAAKPIAKAPNQNGL